MTEPVAMDTLARSLPRSRLLASLDTPLLVGMVLMIGVGLVVLVSASHPDTHWIGHQVVRVGVAIAAMLLVAQLPPEMIRTGSRWFYLLALVLLIASHLSFDKFGVTHWLQWLTRPLSKIGIEPAEMMKLALPLAVVAVLTSRNSCRWHSSRRWRHALWLALVVFVPVALVAPMVPFNHSIILSLVGLCALLLFAAWRAITLLVLLLVLTTASVVAQVSSSGPTLFPYTRTSYTAEQNQAVYAYRAVFEGGVTGEGYMAGRITHRWDSQGERVLPNRTNLLMVVVLAEEFGMLGVLGLLSLIVAITVRGMVLALRSTDRFARPAAATLAWTFLLSAAINMATALRVLASPAAPMPLMGDAGNAYFFTLAGFGALMALTRQQAPAVAGHHHHHDLATAVHPHTTRRQSVLRGMLLGTLVIAVITLLTWRYIYLLYVSGPAFFSSW